jgi:hypothetical protein
MDTWGPVVAQASNKELSYALHNLRGGLNYAMPQHAIADNQCSDAKNIIFESGAGAGWTFAPGYQSADVTAGFAAKIWGAYVHRAVDGTETQIVVAGAKVYTYVGVTATQIYDFGTAAGHCFSVAMFGKLFICNGVDTCKVEKVGSAIVAYRVGIVAPVGPTVVSGGSGGTLAPGVYTVYLSYARAGLLYSFPTICAATATIAADQILTVTCPISLDPQVTLKVAWVIEPGGTVAYFYKSAANTVGGATTFTITSAASKDINLVMLAECASVYRPPVFQGIFGFDNRLYGWMKNDNILYYSVQGTVYDCEKFINPSDSLTGYRREIQANIVSCFSVGSTLCVNTVNGVRVIPNGDTSAKILPVEETLYFKYPHTVRNFAGRAWGLTQDGFRYFDGTSFSQDLSKDIKPVMDAIAAGAAAEYEPMGFIYRRGLKRTEYHLCFRDITTSTTMITGHIVLNLDTLAITDQNNYTAAWELWTTAFGDMFTMENGLFYGTQTTDGIGIVCQEQGSADNYLLDKTGAFVAAEVTKPHYIKSKLFIPDAKGVLNFDTPGGILARVYTEFQITLYQPDNNNAQATKTFSPAGATPIVISDSTYMPDAVFSDADGVVMPAEYPAFYKVKWPVKQSRMAYFEFSHNGKDDNFRLYEYQQPMNWERNNAA